MGRIPIIYYIINLLLRCSFNLVLIFLTGVYISYYYRSIQHLAINHSQSRFKNQKVF